MLNLGGNLWHWLRQTRELNNLELFWFDAICINQDNITEKNHQLLWMKDLYSKVRLNYLNHKSLALMSVGNLMFYLAWYCCQRE